MEAYRQLPGAIYWLDETHTNACHTQKRGEQYRSQYYHVLGVYDDNDHRALLMMVIAITKDDNNIIPTTS